MPRLADLIEAMDAWYDPNSAEEWDAVGLVCGDPSEDVSRVLLAVDAVPATVAEAFDMGAQLLITHHPLLLDGVHGVPANEPKGGLVHRMIRAGVAHFVAHTNADIANPGVSDALADRLGLDGLRPLDVSGIGRVGELRVPMSLREFTAHAAAVLPPTVWGVRAAGDPEWEIRTVAVCGGSGGSFAAVAKSSGADVLLTSDLKHHSGLETVTERGADALALVDAAHWATESPWLDAVAARLRDRFGTSVEVSVSRLPTDPWTLHVPSPESSPTRL